MRLEAGGWRLEAVMNKVNNEGGVNRVIAIVDTFNKWFEFLGIVILCIMTLAVFGAVLSRFFVGVSLSWVEESATFAMAWIAALGAGLTARKGGLTTIEIGVKWLPPKIKRVVTIIAVIISFFIFAVIMYFGTQMAIIVNTQHATTIPMLTMFWVYIAMPVGIFLVFMNTVIHTIEILRGGEEK